MALWRAGAFVPAHELERDDLDAPSSRRPGISAPSGASRKQTPTMDPSGSSCTHMIRPGRGDLPSSQTVSSVPGSSEFSITTRSPPTLMLSVQPETARSAASRRTRSLSSRRGLLRRLARSSGGIWSDGGVRVLRRITEENYKHRPCPRTEMLAMADIQQGRERGTAQWASAWSGLWPEPSFGSSKTETGSSRDSWSRLMPTPLSEKKRSFSWSRERTRPMNRIGMPACV